MELIGGSKKDLNETLSCHRWSGFIGSALSKNLLEKLTRLQYLTIFKEECCRIESIKEQVNIVMEIFELMTF